MAYAGICGSDNVQGNSDDHFHAVSIDEMWSRITSFTQPTCSTNTPNGNTAPVVNAGQNYTIPNGTAFTLSGTATDADGDILVLLLGTNRYRHIYQPTQLPQAQQIHSLDRTHQCLLATVRFRN